MTTRGGARQYTIEAAFFRLLAKTAGALLLLTLISYPVDFAIWRVRLAISHDTSGMGSVPVTRLVAAELKGGKEDYYFDGTTTVACSESLFPQGGVERLLVADTSQRSGRAVLDHFTLGYSSLVLTFPKVGPL